MRKFAITYLTQSETPTQGSGLVTSWFTCRVDTKGTGLMSEKNVHQALAAVGAPNGILLAINELALETEG